MNSEKSNNTCPQCGLPVPLEAPHGLCPKCVLAGADNLIETGQPSLAPGDAPSPERVAGAFPQLEIVELVGRGGMGFVFKARQVRLDRFVALKLLPDALANDPHFAERFNREGRVLARLNHPNIVSVYDFGQAGGFYFLLMEFVDGVNLRQAMRAGKFSPAEALAIVPPICEALQYAHEKGVLHRDIKPENILLDTQGRVKIADFGIAKLIGPGHTEATLTGTGVTLGTPHYMAPEQLENPSDVDHRADIYSLGVVFYEMLTGELPLGRFAPPSTKTPVDARVDEVVFRTLEKEPAKRFQSASEVKTRVEDLRTPGASQPAPPRSGIAPVPSLSGPAAVSQDGGVRHVSTKAIVGAALAGVSLVFPLLLVLAVLMRLGGIGPWELWLTLGLGLVPGIAATILGWLALSDIRESQGQLRGLPLALFAALAWPLLLLVSLLVVAPFLILIPVRNTDARPSIVALLGSLLVPAGVLTFAVWAVYATARWASGRASEERRGVLRWIFLALLVFGLALTVVRLKHVSVAMAPQPPPEEETAPAGSQVAPVRVQFRLAQGQATTFELHRKDTVPPAPVRFFNGYLVASDAAPVQAEFVLSPTPPLATMTNSRAWTMALVAEGAGQIRGGLEDFGDLISALPPVSGQVYEIPPGSTLDIPLTQAYADGADTHLATARPVLNLVLHSTARREQVAAPQASVAFGNATTNWVQALRDNANAETRSPFP